MVAVAPMGIAKFHSSCPLSRRHWLSDAAGWWSCRHARTEIDPGDGERLQHDSADSPARKDRAGYRPGTRTSTAADLRSASRVASEIHRRISRVAIPQFPDGCLRPCRPYSPIPDNPSARRSARPQSGRPLFESTPIKCCHRPPIRFPRATWIRLRSWPPAARTGRARCSCARQVERERQEARSLGAVVILCSVGIERTAC